MSHSRTARSGRPLGAVVLAAAVVVATAGAALAAFGDTDSVGANLFATDVLDPPAALQLTPTCTGATPGAVPTFVANSQTTGFNGPVTVTRPVGTQAGDVLIAQITADDTNSVSAPGWTLIRQDKDVGDGFWQAILYRVAVASEPVSYTLTPSQSAPGEIVFGVNTYRGVDTANPVNAQGGQITSAFIATVTAPSITTTMANTRLVAFFGRDGDEFLNAPASMTQRWALNGASLPEDIAGTSADQSFPTAGATGTRVATTTGSNNGIGHLIALAPASTSGVAGVNATWTATPSGFASGYRLQRWRLGVLESEQVIGSAGTVSASDGPLTANATYEYRLFAAFQNWTSSVATSTVTTTCGSAPAMTATALWRRSGDMAPRASTWDGTNFTANTATATLGEWRVVQAAASATRDEVIATGVNTDGKSNVEVRSNGTWSEPFGASLGGPTVTTRWGVEVAYESTSGDALLVWNNGTTGTAGVSYRVWNGTIWSASTAATTPVAGEPQQLHLAANPNSDEMVLAVTNGAGNDYAMVWNGSSWVTSDAVVLDPGTGDDGTDSNVAYEQQTGRAMVTYGRDATTVRWRVWNGAAWSAESVLAEPGGSVGHVRWTTLGPDPGSNRIALGVITDAAATWLAVWDGSAWVDRKLAAGTGASAPAAPNVAVGFEGLSGDAMAVYGEGTTNRVQYRTWTSGAGWTLQQDGPGLGSGLNSMVLDPRPGSDHLALGVQTDNGRLTYLIWDGSGWAALALMETNTGETGLQPFVWVWR